MVPLRRFAALAAVLLVVLAPLAVTLHDHDGALQPGGHTDCDACHFRNLSLITTDGAPAPTTPDLLVHAVVSAPAAVRLHVALGIRPTRGPPA